jgi:hypothetical protein
LRIVAHDEIAFGSAGPKNETAEVDAPSSEIAAAALTERLMTAKGNSLGA